MSDIAQARAHWADVIKHEGGICPVCNRWGRIYRRGINRTMARSLIWLSSQEGDENGWVDVPATAPKDVVRTNQLSTLKWWGLIESAANDDPKKKRSGVWRMTYQGRLFVDGEIRVPKFVYTYNDSVREVSLETVSLRDCFEDPFDYRAVMQAHYPEVRVEVF